MILILEEVSVGAAPAVLMCDIHPFLACELEKHVVKLVMSRVDQYFGCMKLTQAIADSQISLRIIRRLLLLPILTR